MSVEPATADPEDVARKVAAAPDLKMPPPPEWVLDADGRVVDFKMQGMGFRRKARNRLGRAFLQHVHHAHPVAHDPAGVPAADGRHDR